MGSFCVKSALNMHETDRHVYLESYTINDISTTILETNILEAQAEGGGGGGDSHIKWTGVLVGNFEKNP